MYNEELAKIPIGKLLCPNGLVAIWCTNAPSHLHSICNDIFPSWGITYRAKWYWVKVSILLNACGQLKDVIYEMINILFDLYFRSLKWETQYVILT